MADETVAERLLVISDLGTLRFRPEVFVEAGTAFWVEGDTLKLRQPDGTVREVSGVRQDRLPGRRYNQPGLGAQDA